MKRHQDIYIGLIILIACGYFTYLSLQFDTGSATMPLILLGIMAFLGLIITIDGLKKTRAASSDNPVKPFITLESLKVPLIMFVQIALYIFLFFAVGYYIATGLFLITSMSYLKQKSWLMRIITAVCFIAFTYFFLVMQLNISIDPLGWLGTYIQMS